MQLQRMAQAGATDYSSAATLQDSRVCMFNMKKLANCSCPLYLVPVTATQFLNANNNYNILDASAACPAAETRWSPDVRTPAAAVVKVQDKHVLQAA